MDSFLAIPVAALLPYIPHLIKAMAVNAKLQKGYDLKNPRASVLAASDDTPEGRFIQRCQGAHNNGLESWPQFAVAVLVANAAGVDRDTQNTAAAVYVLSRLAYTYLYCYGTSGKLALGRSTSWMVGVGACLYLMVKAVMARNP
jgi:uncharacterized MAPEG superfamily protein